MAILEFNNVSKSFGEGAARTQVLNGVDLKVDGLSSERAEQVRSFIIEKCGEVDSE